ncbi:hypothetical protein RGQ15_09565 [Paracoccus sp. MBLB3053]|uniref:Uncharacterized protein n=1 Tax=Paracoccus aurantius TaxID=3073814 RepID=A0ABU2HT88_9RHOB|nr:hypothetical protein [Paracoccus sp. MBLB3053]MDS9467814.1 hypothetical protein [Paracoccus sp. MBLB3053]
MSPDERLARVAAVRDSLPPGIKRDAWADQYQRIKRGYATLAEAEAAIDAALEREARQ